MNKQTKIAEPKVQPDRKKRGGADPTTSGGRQVNQNVICVKKNDKTAKSRLLHRNTI
jgi:hypothetical protein